MASRSTTSPIARSSSDLSICPRRRPPRTRTRLLDHADIARLTALPTPHTDLVARLATVPGLVRPGVRRRPRRQDREVLRHVLSGRDPRRIRVGPATAPGLPVKVAVIEELGSDAFLYGTAEHTDEKQQIIARIGTRLHNDKGTLVHLAPDADKLHLFSTSTEERLTA
ncbi:TOBE domain-containing protein [Kribbella sp. NPDC026596]|uniref:TOBE domain-containing protein n=1 Tax=Kribbella sp. NPDC026596 TaxID=3155122 RepID=UPI003408E202